MRVGIALPTLAEGDGVGNDALGMARALRGRGHDVEFFVRTSRAAEPTRLLDEAAAVLRGPDDVLIYHHSIGCEAGVRLVERSPVRRTAVKYHNVTPPEYFARTSPAVARECEAGLAQVARLARTRAAIWADSEFNARHVRGVSPGRAVAVLPPFHQTDQLAAADPDFRAVAGLDDWTTNVLVVGRLAPNKNVPLAVRAFADYRARFDPRARLVVAGARPDAGHAAAVDALVRTLGQEPFTVFTGRVTVPQLKALYLTADVLLVTSDHEGFCVPLVEAMGLRVPVVAVPAAAVPCTGGAAARYAEADPARLADALHAVLSDPAAREARIARGWDRYEEAFATEAIDRRFGDLFDRLAGRLPALAGAAG